MATRYIVISVTPGTAVATDGTIDFPYPAGYDAAADFSQDNEVLVLRGLQNTLTQAADTFTVAYDGNSATVTYKGLTTIPAGTECLLMIEVSNFSAITALTDNSGGTASDTIAAQTGSYVQATQQNTIASLAAKINALTARVNTLLALSRNGDVVP